ARRSASRADVRLQGARELRAVIGDGEAQRHANVSRVTFLLGDFDSTSASKALTEKWISKFFDQCAKLGGLLWDHKFAETSAGVLKGRDSNENRLPQGQDRLLSTGHVA